MTREERNTKLKHFITCLKCEVSGKECDANCSVQYEAGNMGEIIENLEAISKALEQEPCDDEYIKVPKKALKYRTAGMVAYNAKWLKNHFDIERAVICGAQGSCDVFDKYGNYKYPSDVELTEPNTATSMPCEDAINRQAALGCCRNEWEEEVEERLKSLPPVNPQVKTGHWIFDEILDKHYYCSECKSMGVDYWDYCPYCGAKMIEPQAEKE